MNRNRGSAASRARARLPPLPVAAVVVAAIGRAIGRGDRRSSSIARRDRADRARSRRASDTRATARPRDRADAPADARPRGDADADSARVDRSSVDRSIAIDRSIEAAMRAMLDRSFEGRVRVVFGSIRSTGASAGRALGGDLSAIDRRCVDRSSEAGRSIAARGVDRRRRRSIDRDRSRPSGRAARPRAPPRAAGVRDAGECFARSVGRRRRTRW